MNQNSSSTGSGSGLGNKVRGAAEAIHGIGENIRGTALGAVDTITRDGTKNDEIAHRGRLETSQGVAKMRGGTYKPTETTSQPLGGSSGDARVGGGVGYDPVATDPKMGHHHDSAIPNHNVHPPPAIGTSASTTHDATVINQQQYGGGTGGPNVGLGGSNPDLTRRFDQPRLAHAGPGAEVGGTNPMPGHTRGEADTSGGYTYQ